MLRKALVELWRTRTVDRLGVLASSDDLRVQRFVEKAAQACAAPMALLSILREDRLHVTAASGFERGCMPRGDSICHRAVEREDLTEICDTHADPILRTLPVVADDPFLRYYLGVPLRIGDGPAIGMLCVMDTRPRPPASPDQRAYLAALARQIASVLASRSAGWVGRAA